MPAYLLVRANITDMEQYAEYMKLTPAIVEKFGGRFLIRGGDKVVLEGPDQPERIVLLKFDSIEAAQRMYNSDDYQAAIRAARGRGGSFLRCHRGRGVAIMAKAEDTCATMPPSTQNTLRPAMSSSPSLMPRGGGRGVGLVARRVGATLESPASTIP